MGCFTVPSRCPGGHAQSLGRLRRADTLAHNIRYGCFPKTYLTPSRSSEPDLKAEAGLTYPSRYQGHLLLSGRLGWLDSGPSRIPTRSAVGRFSTKWRLRQSVQSQPTNHHARHLERHSRISLAPFPWSTSKTSRTKQCCPPLDPRFVPRMTTHANRIPHEHIGPFVAELVFLSFRTMSLCPGHPLQGASSHAGTLRTDLASSNALMTAIR